MNKEKATPVSSSFRRTTSMLFRNKESIIGIVIVAVYVSLAVAVTVANSLKITITPYNPLQQNVGPSLGSPTMAHPFGVDFLGRDVFSRVLASIPNGLLASFTVVAVAISIGALIGSVAAFKGGLFDELLMRFTDVIFALPALVIAMVIVGGSRTWFNAHDDCSDGYLVASICSRSPRRSIAGLTSELH